VIHLSDAKQCFRKHSPLPYTQTHLTHLGHWLSAKVTFHTIQTLVILRTDPSSWQFPSFPVCQVVHFGAPLQSIQPHRNPQIYSFPLIKITPWSWKVSTCVAIKQLSSILWDPQGHYGVQKSHPHHSTSPRFILTLSALILVFLVVSIILISCQ
jgi:hypothetical protein